MPAFVRSAIPSDIPAIRQLESELALLHNALRPDLYRAHPGLRTEEDFLEWLNVPDRYVFVAVSPSEEVVGAALCLLKDTANSDSYQALTRLHIHRFCVREDCRRQGIGALLMDACRQAALSRGCYSMELNVQQCNEEAVAFYRSQGFEDEIMRMELVLPGKAIDLSNTYLQTPRLLLRPWREDDLEDFFAYASIPGLGEMAGWPHHETMDISRSVLRSFIEGKEIFAIQHLESGKVIGSLGLHESWAEDEPALSGLRCRDIGYVLSRDHWGQGLMPEAVQAVIAYCFNALRMDVLSVDHFTENAQSRRVVEKTGFHYYGDGVCHAELLNREIAVKKYVLLRPGLSL